MSILQSKSARHLLSYYILQLEKNGYDSTPIIEGSISYDTTVSKNDESFKIQVNFGQKGLKTVVMGNKESDLYWKIFDIIYDKTDNKKKKPTFTEPENYIGTYDSGKGDYFGPLVVCAVYVNKELIEELKKLGTRDLRLIKDDTLQQTAENMKKALGEKNYFIFKLSPEEYNTKHVEYKNIHNLLGLGHSTAIRELVNKVECEDIFTEKFGKNNIIQEFLKSIEKPVRVKQVIRSERFTGVAAASIIAKAEAAKWFEEINTKYNSELTKGASMNVAQHALPLIEEHTHEVINEIAKVHFKTTRKLEKRFGIVLVPKPEAESEETIGEEIETGDENLNFTEPDTDNDNLNEEQD